MLANALVPVLAFGEHWAKGPMEGRLGMSTGIPGVQYIRPDPHLHLHLHRICICHAGVGLLPHGYSGVACGYTPGMGVPRGIRLPGSTSLQH